MELTYAENLMVLLLVMGGLSTVFGVAGFFSDHVIPSVQHWWAWRQAKKQVMRRTKAARGVR